MGGILMRQIMGANIDLYHQSNDNLFVDFLEGIRENRSRFGFNLSYEIFRNLFIKFNVQDDVFSKSDNEKLKSTLMCFSLGINY